MSNFTKKILSELNLLNNETIIVKIINNNEGLIAKIVIKLDKRKEDIEIYQHCKGNVLIELESIQEIIRPSFCTNSAYENLSYNGKYTFVLFNGSKVLLTYLGCNNKNNSVRTTIFMSESLAEKSNIIPMKEIIGII